MGLHAPCVALQCYWNVYLVGRFLSRTSCAQQENIEGQKTNQTLAKMCEEFIDRQCLLLHHLDTLMLILHAGTSNMHMHLVRSLA